MGFNPTFYAGRPKLSEVTIDSDLNMGGRNISNVDTLGVDTIGANLIRAGRVDSPYRPEPWPTEELAWGDGEPEQLHHAEHAWAGGTLNDQTIMTVARGTRITVTLAPVSGKETIKSVSIKVNGVVAATYSNAVTSAQTFGPFVANAGNVIVINAMSNATGTTQGRALVTIESTGEVYGAKTFNLTGKWLALGLDMKGLEATVKIQGVEIPYSDYAKYFPLAPSELKTPGNWSPTQDRPVIKVYK